MAKIICAPTKVLVICWPVIPVAGDLSRDGVGLELTILGVGDEVGVAVGVALITEAFNAEEIENVLVVEFVEAGADDGVGVGLTTFELLDAGIGVATTVGIGKFVGLLVGVG